MQIYNFWDDITDVLAKKEPLVGAGFRVDPCCARTFRIQPTFITSILESCQTRHARHAVIFISNLNNLFAGYFVPPHINYHHTNE